MNLERKTVTLKLEDAEKGTVAADIATLDVVDHDGDITRQGFFGTQPAAIVQSHDWGSVMLGKGVITDEDGEKARFTGTLNTHPDDLEARQLHSRLRFDLDEAHGPPIIEWSYGFEISEGGSRPLDPAENDGARRELIPNEDGTPGGLVAEVSPVVLGAGEGTGTTAIKSGASQQLADHVGSQATGLAALADRLAKVRAAHGGHLGEATKDTLAELSAAMIEVGEALADPVDDPPPKGEHDDPPKDESHDGDDPPAPTLTADDEYVLEQTAQRLRG